MGEFCDAWIKLYLNKILLKDDCIQIFNYLITRHLKLVIQNLLQQLHNIIRLTFLLCFQSVILSTVAFGPHAHLLTVPTWLLQLQGQVHIHNKKENGFSEILAPAGLPYKRKSTCRHFPSLSLDRTRSHATPICKKVRMWANSKGEWMELVLGLATLLSWNKVRFCWQDKGEGAQRWTLTRQLKVPPSPGNSKCTKCVIICSEIL